jgi:3-phenylpropionate/trans-cinnamate dioxygenase ferredoxin subunit
MSKASAKAPSAVALEGSRYDVGGVDEFPPGSRRVINVGNRAVGVINAGGTLYAVLDVCPHELVSICEHGAVGGTPLPSKPGEIEFGLEDRVLRCPWHGYEFDLQTGSALFTNFRGRLRTFQVEAEHGRVIVDVKARGRVGG